MPKSSNQKLKLWYVYKILFEHSDENHPLTLSQIISLLKNYGITAERKSLYSDIELLCEAGVDIVSEKRDKFVYYIGERDFQLAELKLLVDCVLASRFITAKKSAELVSKLSSLTSKSLAGDLKRQVYISDRVKGINERIYYNIDLLHDAIGRRKNIKFKYYKYNFKDTKQFKNNSDFYVVSPYALVYSDDNYYLLAHYPKYEGVTHFRVDKMTEVALVDEGYKSAESVNGADFNPAEYVKRVFSMFKGHTDSVRLMCDESVLNVIADKFGENAFIRKESDTTYAVTVKADISPTFFAWVFMLGDNVKINSPQSVVEEYQEMLKQIQNKYK